MHEASIENKVLSANDLGKFHCYVNSKLSCKSGIAPLINSDGKYMFENRSKANLLNDYFASVCVVDNGVMPAIKSKHVTNKLSDTSFSSIRLYNIMRKLKNSLTAGPDNYPSMF